jgi:hypothetical protein
VKKFLVSIAHFSPTPRPDEIGTENITSAAVTIWADDQNVATDMAENILSTLRKDGLIAEGAFIDEVFELAEGSV